MRRLTPDLRPPWNRPAVMLGLLATLAITLSVCACTPGHSKSTPTVTPTIIVPPTVTPSPMPMGPTETVTSVAPAQPTPTTASGTAAPAATATQAPTPVSTSTPITAPTRTPSPQPTGTPTGTPTRVPERTATPSGAATLYLNPNPNDGDDPISVTGAHYGANEQVKVTIDGHALGTGTTDAAGNLTGGPWPLPPPYQLSDCLPAGTYTVIATGVTSGRAATVTYKSTGGDC